VHIIDGEVDILNKMAYNLHIKVFL